MNSQLPELPDTSSRISAAGVRRATIAGNAETLLITHADNVFWLTGNWDLRHSIWLLLAQGHWHTIEVGAIPHEALPSTAAPRTASTLPEDTVRALIRESRAATPVPVDRGPSWIRTRGALLRTLLADGRTLVDSIRSHKDNVEQAILRWNYQAVRDVLAEVAATAIPHTSEHEIWTLLKRGLIERGPETLQLYGNCATGERSNLANPHATNRIVRRGDIVLLDVYPRMHGYFGDVTRTWVCAQEMTHRTRRMYAAVEEALSTAAEMLAPGVLGKDIDRAARDVLARHGYPNAYKHHTGHGMGVRQQEPPWIRQGSTDMLAEGMVVALEPACYVDGEGGIRLEDEYIITAHGARLLSGASSG